MLLSLKVGKLKGAFPLPHLLLISSPKLSFTLKSRALLLSSLSSDEKPQDDRKKD